MNPVLKLMYILNFLDMFSVGVTFFISYKKSRWKIDCPFQNTQLHDIFMTPYIIKIH